MSSSVWENIQSRTHRVVRAVREFLYGMTTYEWVRDVRRERGEVERLFVLITFGDITPLLPAAAIAILTIGVNFVVDWFLHKTSGLRDDQ